MLVLPDKAAALMPKNAAQSELNTVQSCLQISALGAGGAGPLLAALLPRHEGCLVRCSSRGKLQSVSTDQPLQLLGQLGIEAVELH